jgi:hypothetical protein
MLFEAISSRSARTKMTKKLIKMFVGMSLLLVTLTTQAVPITGSIQFVGTATMNASQTAFISFGNPIGGGLGPWVQGGSQTGGYAGIAGGTTAIWTPFTFNPPAASVTPLWMLTVGTTTYSFDATSMSVTHPNATTVNISGTGIAHITGFADTLGTWTVTATGSGVDFTFGATTGPGGNVADGGTTVLLLGAALSGVALLRRKLVSS